MTANTETKVRTKKEGEEFLAHLEPYRDEFYRYILRTVWDSSVADDVFSQGVLAAYENWHKFRKGTNFRAWMYKIFTNKCFVANREIGRTPAPLNEETLTIADVSAESGYKDVLENPEAVFEECGDEVYLALRSLSTAQRSCILLRGVEQFSYQEIADILEIPVGTVMTHLSRGRAKLRKELLDYAHERGIVRAYPRLVSRENDERGLGERTISNDDK